MAWHTPGRSVPSGHGDGGVSQTCAALLLHPPGSFIPRKMGAPHTLRTHLPKLPAQHRLHGLRDQSLPPVGAGDPVAELRLPSPLRYLRGKYADGADGAAVPVLWHHGKGSLLGQHRPDDLPAVLHRGVGRPSGGGAYLRVAGPAVQRLGIALLPRPQQQPFRFHHSQSSFGSVQPSI